MRAHLPLLVLPFLLLGCATPARTPISFEPAAARAAPIFDGHDGARLSWTALLD
ncbi:MAG: hypothetical protein HKO59_01345, partial [Phycisphaerales bacterium]|nr:hypothetical protein [Phycisphaerales bacterium]